MTVHDLVKLDARIRETLSAINAAGLQLHGRREDLTDKGLKAQWQEIVNQHTPKVESLATEVDEVAAALSKVHEHETDHLLPEGALTVAEELFLARLLARPNVYGTQTFAAVIAPHLGTRIATAIVEEVQARNKEVTDEYVSAILASSSVMFGQATRDHQIGTALLDVLRQGIQALRDALDYRNVSDAPLDHHNRPGAGIPTVQAMLGRDAKYRIGSDGDTHV